MILVEDNKPYSVGVKVFSSKDDVRDWKRQLLIRSDDIRKVKNRMLDAQSHMLRLGNQELPCDPLVEPYFRPLDLHPFLPDYRVHFYKMRDPQAATSSVDVPSAHTDRIRQHVLRIGLMTEPCLDGGAST